MSFLLGGHKMIRPTQGGLLKKFENHWLSTPNTGSMAHATYPL